MSKVTIGLGGNQHFRIYTADITDILQTIHENLNTSELASAAIGRLTAANAMLTFMQKDNLKVSSVINGDGPLGQIIADCNNKGEIKATVKNPQEQVDSEIENKINVSAGVGTGTLKVIKDNGGKDPIIGEVNLVSGEIATDMAYYFDLSEQLRTAVILGTKVNPNFSILSSVGIIIQVMPGADDEELEELSNKIKNSEKLTTMIEKMSLEEICKMYFEDYEKLEEIDLSYKCSCSEERYLASIKLLDKKEIEDIKKDETIEVRCDFCHKIYNIETNKI